jgi:glyoxylase-like metal-dependent hydrolase (beta-lactamase superfamily II)
VETEIHKLSLGPCNCYLIKEEGLILVDAGSPNQGKKFLKALRDLSIEPADISLVLLTHGHWDHIGSANELKILTGSKVEQGLTPLPPAISLVGRVVALIMKMSMPLAKLSSTSVDIILEDTEFSLGTFGIHGRVLYTPGHSSGSMSLLLDTGEAFVGDSAMNGLPLRIGPGMPAFAEDVGALRESWRLLLLGRLL